MLVFLLIDLLVLYFDRQFVIVQILSLLGEFICVEVFKFLASQGQILSRSGKLLL